MITESVPDWPPALHDRLLDALASGLPPDVAVHVTLGLLEAGRDVSAHLPTALAEGRVDANTLARLRAVTDADALARVLIANPTFTAYRWAVEHAVDDLARALGWGGRHPGSNNRAFISLLEDVDSAQVSLRLHHQLRPPRPVRRFCGLHPYSVLLAPLGALNLLLGRPGIMRGSAVAWPATIRSPGRRCGTKEKSSGEIPRIGQ